MISRIRPLFISLILSLSLSQCAYLDQEAGPPYELTKKGPITPAKRRKYNFGKLFGNDALTLGPGSKKDKKLNHYSSHTNPFLWQAALGTLEFMPLASSDSMGGVIITDWYIDPSSPQQRCKVTVYIKGPELKATRLSVVAYIQQKSGAEWGAVIMDKDLGIELEKVILRRAQRLGSPSH